MNNQILPTYVLQAVVNYLETKPYSEVQHLLKAILEHSKPEVVPELVSQMKDPFFITDEGDNDPEPK